MAAIARTYGLPHLTSNMAPIVRTYGLPHPAMNTQMDLQSSVLRLWRAPDLRRNDRLWSSECSAVGNPHEPSFSFQRLFTSLVMPP